MTSDMKKFNTFIFEEVEPSIGLVTLNRPEQLNAQNVEMLAEFEELFRILSDYESTLKVLIITGAGKAYCSGADLNDAMAHKDTEAFADPELFLKIVQERYANLILGMRKIPQPIISAVNGPAAGGGFAMTLAVIFALLRLKPVLSLLLSISGFQEESWDALIICPASWASRGPVRFCLPGEKCGRKKRNGSVS